MSRAAVRAGANHLLVRKEGVSCTRCFVFEPVHPGDGTPLETMIQAYELIAKRHSNCGGKR